MVHKLLLMLCLLGVLLSFSNAQIGLNATYFRNSGHPWYLDSETGETDDPIMDKGYTFGVNYWFRLKNYRVEFFPELNAGWATSETFASGRDNRIAFQHLSASLFFNTQFYLLNIKGDCNCPTFSKEGPTFEKGLFLFLSPGVTLLNTKVTRLSETINDEALSFSMGGGIGMDFGVSDLVTITPMLGVRYFPKANFPELEGINDWLGPIDRVVAEEKLLQYFAGLRVGFRFDYNNRRRRW